MTNGVSGIRVSVLSLWLCGHGCSAGVSERLVGVEKFASRVAESVNGTVDESGGGEFAGWFAIRFQCDGKCGYFAVEGELGEGAMDLPA